MQAIREIDHEFREIANIVGLLNMVTLGYFGKVENQANEKINEAINFLHLMIDRANIHVQKLILQQQEISKMKDEFTSNINHELRTPLTSILGTTDFLLDTMDDLSKEDIRKRIQRISRSSRDLLNLVNELLDFSKQEAGELTCNLSQVNLKSIFQRTKETFEGMHITKDIEFIIDFNDISIENDPEHIYKILMNLLTNAFKFTEQGQIKLKATENNSSVLLTVSDTGQGISETDLQNIFNRFTQGRIQNNKASGTGIGLHFVNKLVKSHGGEIKVKSKIGEGSEFTVIFPIKSACNNKSKGEKNAGKT